MRKYVKKRIKLYKHYRIKKNLQDIHNALKTLKDESSTKMRKIDETIQELDQ
jgi:hypothetical protein